MSTNQSNANVIKICNERLTALENIANPKTIVKVDGKPMKLADVIAVYQQCIATRTALVAQRAAFDEALAARDDAEVTRQAIDEGLRSWVCTEFGKNSQQAKELGFLPRKVGVKSAATKARAVEKLLATRRARHTMGKRQREDVKGSVDSPNPSPPTPNPNPVTSATAVTTDGAATH